MYDNAAADLPQAKGLYDPTTGVVREQNRVFARFYRGTKRDNFHSQESGVPKDIAVDYVEIMQFGERDSTIHEVGPRDRARWPQLWAAYQQDREQIQDGTPLELLFPKEPEAVTTLKANHIHTIEALAATPDSTMHIPFVAEHKKRAQTFIDGVLGKGQKFHALESELTEEKRKRREQDDLIKAMQDRILTLESLAKTTRKD